MQISVLSGGMDNVSDQQPHVHGFESRRRLSLLCLFLIQQDMIYMTSL